jgi:hypothetical protein
MPGNSFSEDEMLEHIAKLPCGYTATFRWDNGMKVQGNLTCHALTRDDISASFWRHMRTQDVSL